MIWLMDFADEEIISLSGGRKEMYENDGSGI